MKTADLVVAAIVEAARAAICARLALEHNARARAIWRAR